MKKNIILVLLVVLVVILSLVAGGLGVYVFLDKSKKVEPSPSPSPVVKETEETSLANPASVYCGEQGGTLRMETTAEGTRGICVLADGTECEEWDYFRGNCPSETENEIETGGESVSEESDEEVFKRLMAERHSKPIGDVQLTIGTNTGSHANGGVKFAGEISGAWWLAAKSGGEWVIVDDGNGTVSCASIAPYNFPTSMVPECWDEASMTLITR